MSAYIYETSPESDEIYIKDNQILDELNDFNAEYANYVRCNYNNKYVDEPNHPPLLDTMGKPLQCSNNDEQINKLQKKYDALNKKITDLKDILLRMPTKSYQNPVPDVQELQSKQKQIVQLRTQIDNNLNELNEYENSIAFSKRKVLDSSIYATLLWTTAATILVLLVFTRL